MRAMLIINIVTASAVISMQMSQIARGQDAGAIALGRALHEKSQDECPYEPIAGETLVQSDKYLSAAEPYRWAALKRRADAEANSYLKKMSAFFGADIPPCAIYGQAVADALLNSMYVLGPPSQPLAAEIDRLNAAFMSSAPNSPDNNIGDLVRRRYRTSGDSND